MANHKKLSELQEKKAIGMYSAGDSTESIAERLYCSAETVRLTLKRLGVPLRQAGGMKMRFRETQLLKMEDLYTQGSSIQDIAEAAGVCWTTVRRNLLERGVKLRNPGFRRGEEHHCWKGGRIVTDNGYVLILLQPDDPFYGMTQIKAGNSRYVLEHRLVMAQALGRPLTETETVHHIDDIRDHNDLDNLQLRIGKHGKHAAFQCADCGSCNVVPVALATQPN